jgi:hypothetical protein
MKRGERMIRKPLVVTFRLDQGDVGQDEEDNLLRTK